jgi:phosphoglycolate phosphatase-like HAD superfamily hydrolase
MNMTMTYRLLIWDFDGTLFDTYPAIVDALLRTLEGYGVHEDYDDVLALARVTLGSCQDTLIERHNLPAEAFSEAWLNRYWSSPPEAQPPFPGVVRICERVCEAGGVNVIFTHRRNATTRQVLDESGLTHLFADVWSADQGHPSKPDPAAFLALMERHGVSPVETLAIGDRPIDVQAGKRAGVATCFFGPIDPGDTDPDIIITDFAELEAILFPR